MSGLMVRFWGTRGSIPTPGRHTEKYGGNTTCLELRHGETRVILDAGSGIRQLGTAWAEEADGPVRAHLLFTHLHWDHIQGFPFFTPAYRPGNAFTIHGEAQFDGGIRELLSGQMRGAYFPVPLTAMQADLTFRDTAPQFEVEGIRVRTVHLPHPGGCLGYRLEADDSTFVLATDSEFDLAALNQDAVRADPTAPRQYDPALLEFLCGVTMLVIDCQYTDEEYETKRSWGHNSVATVVDLCVQVRPDTVVLFHHDPERTDTQVAAMADDVSARLERAGVTETLVLPARERLAMQVRKPIRPLPLPR
jgi:phosphoribosyl 1,2-cyclic phosphodiesterase